MFPPGDRVAGFAAARQHQGKELSYNNLVDLDAAWLLAREFSAPAVVDYQAQQSVRSRRTRHLAEAYRRALACDPISAFGGVIAFNRVLDAETADEVAQLFVECIVAPGYEPAAQKKLASKKNLRLLEMPAEEPVPRAGIKAHSLGLFWCKSRTSTNSTNPIKRGH